MTRPKLGLLALLAPGILVAATGVGAGDIAGAGLAGSHVGYAILWAAVLGAFVKFILNEGLTRWQLATGETLLQGMVLRLGWPVRWFLLLYLLVWSFAVGSSLISAIGVAAHALLPVFADAQTGKIVWGIAHSAVAVVLILLGGFNRFAWVMTVLLVVMFVTVLATAAAMGPDWAAVARGLLVPRIPVERGPEAAQWTLALMGGVGGTLTMLCYGYWIRENGRDGPQFLRACRIDLGVAYTLTALFGVSMVIIGSGLSLGEGKGAEMMIKLADRLGAVLGTPFRWAFLAGAWAAVFTSLLGVWQAVPYLFCDFWRLFTRGRSAGRADEAVDTRSAIYRGYLLSLATVPTVSLWVSFVYVQRTSLMLGAIVMPMLAVALLILNGRTAWVGRAYRNRPLTIAVLIAVLAFFLYAAYVTIQTGKEVVG
jgi:Mn2+/Fe2+ NRAMP family transporter